MSETSGEAGRDIVRVEGVTKTYAQGKLRVPALCEVDLRVRAGEFTALAGPSGSGKTTLLNLVGALDTPTTGRVWVDGADLGALSAAQTARLRLARIGFIFQSFNLIPVLSAYENAEFPLLLRGVPRAEREARVLPLFDAVGLAGLAQRRPHELSGGQQQRVAVARAIAAAPALVLADEPTANLDSATGAALLDLMRALNETHGVTFLFSTHDRMVMDRARRIVRLSDGKIVADERREAAP